MKKIKREIRFGIQEFTCDKCDCIWECDDYEVVKGEEETTVKRYWHDHHKRDVSICDGFFIISGCPSCEKNYSKKFISKGVLSGSRTVHDGDGGLF